MEGARHGPHICRWDVARHHAEVVRRTTGRPTQGPGASRRSRGRHRGQGRARRCSRGQRSRPRREGRPESTQGKGPGCAPRHRPPWEGEARGRPAPERGRGRAPRTRRGLRLAPAGKPCTAHEVAGSRTTHCQVRDRRTAPTPVTRTHTWRNPEQGSARRRRARCGAGAGLPLRGTGPPRESHREDGGPRPPGAPPPHRRSRLRVEAVRDPRPAAPADRPTGAGAALHPRHRLLHRGRLRCHDRRGEREGLPAERHRGVRRRHRLRPQDSERRSTAERRGADEAVADASPERGVRHRHHRAQPWRLGDPSVRRGGATRRQLAGDRRHRRLRGGHERGYPPGRPRAVGRPGRPLHQPRGRECEWTLAASRGCSRCGSRGRSDEGDRGLGEVPRVVRRRR